MQQPIDRIFGLHAVSPAVAWKLLDMLYDDATAVAVSNGAFSALGLICYIGTGSRWYLLAFWLALANGIARLCHFRFYRLSRGSASAVGWAWQTAIGGWSTSAIWGAWSLAPLFEQQKSICVIAAATQSACALGAAVRFGPIPVIGAGQAYITLAPVIMVYTISGDPYLQAYAVFAVLQLAAAVRIGRSLHRQTMDLLLQSEEKSDLLDRLGVSNERLEAANRNLATLATTDALTGVANRRAFDVASEREWSIAVREETSLALLMIDIDHFKAYNDRYGHPEGDACLRDVAQSIIAGLLRPADIAARYGGEEFAVILPATDEQGAALVAARIRDALTLRAIPHAGSPFGTVTVSIGAACRTPRHDGSVASMIAQADDALYVAKRGGRNRFHLTARQPEPAE